MIEGTSLRLLDFIACLVGPHALPVIADAYRDLEATRRAAYDVPWSQAFLRALELESYRTRTTHEPGWLAAQLGLHPKEEERALELLVRSGQVRRHEDGRYLPTRITTVDTRRDPAAAHKLRLFWSRAAAARLETTAPGTEPASAYNLFGVSRADLGRLRESAARVLPTDASHHRRVRAG